MSITPRSPSSRPVPRRGRLEYLLPPALADRLAFLRQRVRFASHMSALSANTQWRNRYAGEDVYVVANGPSLKNFDVAQLKGRKVIVMNNFHLASWKDEPDIVAHCFGEPLDSFAWEDPTAALTGTSARSYWLHVSARASEPVQALARSKGLFFAACITRPQMWGNRAIDLSRPSLAYQTTAQLAISVALHMGFARIILIGFDHDWLCTRGHSPHFYGNNSTVQPSDLSKFSYHDMIQISDRMWQIYFALRGAADRVGARIVNLSEPSYLDVFDRVLEPASAA